MARRLLASIATEAPPKLIALGAFGFVGKHVINRAQSLSSRYRLGVFYLLCLALLVLRNLHKPLRPIFVATVLTDALLFLQAALHDDNHNAHDGARVTGRGTLNGKLSHKEKCKRTGVAEDHCPLLRLDAETFGECMGWVDVEDLCTAAVCSSSMMERCLEAFGRLREVGVEALKESKRGALSMEELRLFGLQRRCRDTKAAFQRSRARIYLVEEGKVKAVERNRLRPSYGTTTPLVHWTTIHLPRIEVAVSISCGEHHIAAVMHTGHLYTWGKCTRGELGHGLAEENCSYPRRVLDTLTELHVVQASCGRLHTACVCRDGSLYTFGNGQRGRLGNCECRHAPPSRKDIWRGASSFHASRCDRSTPAAVDTKENERFQQVSCGEEHTAAVTMTGRIYTFGDARDGVLAHEDGVDSFWDCCYSPKQCVTSSQTDRFVKVDCSYRRTMALSRDGHLYVSGSVPRLTKMEQLNAFAVNFYTSAKIVFIVTHRGEVMQMHIDDRKAIPITPVPADGASSFMDDPVYEHELFIDEVLPVPNCVLLRNRTGSFHTLKVQYARKQVESEASQGDPDL